MQNTFHIGLRSDAYELISVKRIYGARHDETVQVDKK